MIPQNIVQRKRLQRQSSQESLKIQNSQLNDQSININQSGIQQTAPHTNFMLQNAYFTQAGPQPASNLETSNIIQQLASSQILNGDSQLQMIGSNQMIQLQKSTDLDLFSKSNILSSSNVHPPPSSESNHQLQRSPLETKNSVRGLFIREQWSVPQNQNKYKMKEILDQQIEENRRFKEQQMKQDLERKLQFKAKFNIQVPIEPSEFNNYIIIQENSSQQMQQQQVDIQQQKIGEELNPNTPCRLHLQIEQSPANTVSQHSLASARVEQQVTSLEQQSQSQQASPAKESNWQPLKTAQACKKIPFLQFPNQGAAHNQEGHSSYLNQMSNSGINNTGIKSPPMFPLLQPAKVKQKQIMEEQLQQENKRLHNLVNYNQIIIDTLVKAWKERKDLIQFFDQQQEQSGKRLGYNSVKSASQAQSKYNRHNSNYINSVSKSGNNQFQMNSGQRMKQKTQQPEEEPINQQILQSQYTERKILNQGNDIDVIYEESEFMSNTLEKSPQKPVIGSQNVRPKKVSLGNNKKSNATVKLNDNKFDGIDQDNNEELLKKQASQKALPLYKKPQCMKQSKSTKFINLNPHMNGNCNMSENGKEYRNGNGNENGNGNTEQAKQQLSYSNLKLKPPKKISDSNLKEDSLPLYNVSNIKSPLAPPDQQLQQFKKPFSQYQFRTKNASLYTPNSDEVSITEHRESRKNNNQ